MNYVAMLPDGDCAVELVEHAPGRFSICIDGRSYEVDSVTAADGRNRSLLIDGRSYAVEIEQQQRTLRVTVGGMSQQIEILDLRQAHMRHARLQRHDQDGPQALLAPMPGKVVAILVKLGDAVQAGAGLVVVEAMKMENELRAPRAGVITRIDAVVGMAVESGAQLCDIG